MNILKEKNNFLILTHKKPDGDTLGSASALCRGLRSLGKTAYVLENFEITEKYASLFDGIVATNNYRADVIVSVDIADEQLFPNNANEYKGNVDLAIDHHPSNTNFAKETLLKAERAACGEIIYEVLQDLNVEMDKDMATAIYVAVSTDTGCFKYSNTTGNTHIVAARCLEKGIDGGELNRKLFEVKSHARFQLEKYLFENMEFFFDGKLAIATIDSKILETTQATVDDRDSIASIPRACWRVGDNQTHAKS